MIYKQHLTVVISMAIIVMVLAIAGIRNVHADNINPGVFAIDSKPYGLSYSDWSTLWWKWLLSIPSGSSPAADNTGKDCALGQTGPVWFLAGTFGGSATRTCSIPFGKALFVNPVGGENSYAEYPKLKTAAQLHDSVIAGNQGMVGSVTVDGVPIKDLQGYRVTSGLFNMTFPANNALGVTPGNTQAVSDGIWLMLKPLSAGNHVIHSIGSIFDPTTGTQSYSSDVTYNIIVHK